MKKSIHIQHEPLKINKYKIKRYFKFSLLTIITNESFFIEYFLYFLQSEIQEMQPEKPYAEYMKMSEQQRTKLIYNRPQDQKQSQVIVAGYKYPQEYFIELYSTQDKNAIKLKTYRHETKKQPKGVVAFIHSIFMHTGHSARLAQKLASQGYHCVGLDLRGHGGSEGQKCYLDDIQLVLRDIQNFLQAVKKLYPKLPIFLFGHGAGALISIHLASLKNKQLNLSGIIVSSLTLKKPSSNKLIAMFSNFALKITPNRTGIFSLQYDNQTKNKKASEYIKNDPLVHHNKVYLGTLKQVQEIMNNNLSQDRWDKINLPPIVIIQGEKDKISDAFNAINFYQKLKINDKQIWFYNNMWAYMFFEEQYFEIQERIVKWLDKKTQI